MISKEIFDFLKELKSNNNRGWFNENKTKYQKLKKEWENFVNAFIPEVASIDNSIGVIEPKDCIFRIYRDVRFSKDKSPYKTNFSSFFVKGGKKSGFAGYYIHLEPGSSFIGGGIHMPPGNILKAIRTEIFDFTDEFKQIINNQEFKSYFSELDAEKLKTAPRDFPGDFKDIELLKFKSYTIGKLVSEQEIISNTFPNELKKAFKIMSPFILFLNRAVEHNL
ncbi:DUF2461 domain-containing protein [Bacteroidota bacterium]